MGSEFDESVWRLLRRIPRGKVTTYGRIAAALGKPNAARAVGNACNRNPHAPRVPCHRTVKSGGFIGGYAKGPKRKILLLESEGVKVKNNRALEFDKRLFRF